MRSFCRPSMLRQVWSAAKTLASIETGLLLSVGVATGDTPDVAAVAAARCANARVFPRAERPFDVSAVQTQCPVLVVSAFTLYGDLSSGRRPSWSRAASPTDAEPVFDVFVAELRSLGIEVATGSFGAEMVVGSANHGPLNPLIEIES